MIQLEMLSKVFRKGSRKVRALDGIGLQVEQGEFVVIRGPSGSGKTTLLLAVGGMLRPTSGRIAIGGRDVYAMSERERARFRAENVGFVFQMFHLVPYLTLLENVLLARGTRPGGAPRERALELLKRLGLSDRRSHRPSELSAGEKQRTAIARALLNEPKVILADEPTGNLDPDNAEEVIEALAGYHRGGGTILLVTHGTSADRHAGRVVKLRAGRMETPDPEGKAHDPAA